MTMVVEMQAASRQDPSYPKGPCYKEKNDLVSWQVCMSSLYSIVYIIGLGSVLYNKAAPFRINTKFGLTEMKFSRERVHVQWWNFDQLFIVQ